MRPFGRACLLAGATWLGLAALVALALRHGHVAATLAGGVLLLLGLSLRRGAFTPEQAALDVLAERNRQVHEEGWDAAHDDGHAAGELAMAAGNYCAAAVLTLHLKGQRFDTKPPFQGWLGYEWPWRLHWWKPGTPRQMLVKAAALIIAEIERIDRADAAGDGGSLG